MNIEVTDATFNDKVLQSDKPVVVDFWAEWCGPCKVLSPRIKSLGEEYGEDVVIAECDVDSNPEFPAKYGIRNIPTLLFFKNGEVQDKQVGLTSANNLKKKINALL